MTGITTGEAVLARELLEAVAYDLDGSIPVAILVRICEREGIDLGNLGERSPAYGIVRALLAAETAGTAGVTQPELAFRTTQSGAQTVRTLGNTHLEAVGRTDVVMTVRRDSPPPYGPRRSGRWVAQLIRDERTPPNAVRSLR